MSTNLTYDQCKARLAEGDEEAVLMACTRDNPNLTGAQVEELLGELDEEDLFSETEVSLNDVNPELRDETSSYIVDQEQQQNLEDMEQDLPLRADISRIPDTPTLDSLPTQPPLTRSTTQRRLIKTRPLRRTLTQGQLPRNTEPLMQNVQRLLSNTGEGPSKEGNNRELLEAVAKDMKAITENLESKHQIIKELEILMSKLRSERDAALEEWKLSKKERQGMETLLEKERNKNNENSELWKQKMASLTQNEEAKKQEEENLKIKIKEVQDYIRRVNSLVDTQSQQLLGFTSGGSRKTSPKTTMQKVNQLHKLSRDDLNKLAKSWRILHDMPKKQDLLDALKLVYLMSLMKLEKRSKYELMRLASLFNIEFKRKDELVEQLRKRMKRVKL